MKNTLTIVNEETEETSTYTSTHENIDDFFKFVAEDLKPKKIELIECLQNQSGTWHQFKRRSSLDAYSKFELNIDYTIKGMNLIYATTKSGSHQIWLGHWNNGEV